MLVKMLQSTVSVLEGGAFNFRTCHLQRKPDGDSGGAMVSTLRPSVLNTRPSLMKVELNLDGKTQMTAEKGKAIYSKHGNFTVRISA